jgi:hypothetical protein
MLAKSRNDEREELPDIAKSSERNVPGAIAATVRLSAAVSERSNSPTHNAGEHEQSTLVVQLAPTPHGPNKAARKLSPDPTTNVILTTAIDEAVQPAVPIESTIRVRHEAASVWRASSRARPNDGIMLER